MIFKRLNDYIYDDNRDIKERMFFLSIIVVLGVLSITLVAMIITGASWLQFIAMIVIMILIFIIGLVAEKKRHVKVESIIISFILCFFLFPATFIFGGGLKGSGPAWFIFNIVFNLVVLTGKLRVILSLVEEIIGFLCYILSYTHPELISERNGVAAYIFSFITLLLITMSIAVLVGIENTIYSNQKKKIEKQNKEIEDLVASQNRFFSSMSHEIRTPINTIIGLNEMILREDISDDIAEDAINIRSAGKMLLNTINDILDMSKFQAGDMKLLVETYKTGDMMSDLVGMLWLRAKEKNLEFHVNVSPDIPSELRGDEVRIKQILMNILNNAIKYTKEGSVSLSVQCEKKEDGFVNMIYSVEDTGMGIKKEDIPYLFTAFKRVDEGNTKHIEGTGLGLSIVKQFLDLMGGKVTVNSVYTKGSTFIIEIPQKAATDQVIGEYNYNKGSKIGRRSGYKHRFEAPDAKILVVDDNDSNLLVVTKLLRDTKIKVDTAKNGYEALKLTQDNPYNLIFMDHLMPEMDGIECFRAIRNQAGGKNCDTRIVILTANAGEENRSLYAKEGFNGYLVKPVTGNDLEDEVYRQLPKNLINIVGDSSIDEDTVSWIKENERKKRIVITAEASSDIPKALCRKYDIRTFTQRVRTKEGSFIEGEEIDTQGLLRYMENPENTAKVEYPTVEEYERFFAKQLLSANNIVHIATTSSEENSSYKVAKEAADSFDNVTVIDSRNFSTGQGIAALMACRMAEAGMTVNDIEEKMKRLVSTVRATYMIENMTFLARDGSVNATYAGVLNSLMLHPVTTVKDGSITLKGMMMGSQKRVWRKYIDFTFRGYKPDSTVVFISYAGLAKKDLDWIRAEVGKHHKFKATFLVETSPSVAASFGPGSFGISFVFIK